MTRPIPAGVDGAEEGPAPSAWAGREAGRRGLPLRPVHAWRFEVRDAFGAGDRDARRRQMRDGLVEAARTVAERHPGLTVTTDVVEGGTVPALLAAAAGASSSECR